MSPPARTARAGFSRGGDQLHTYPAHAVQVDRGIGRFTELATQPVQVDVHGLVGPAVGQVPHLSQDLALGDDDAGSLGQIEEEVELLRAQLEARTVEGHGPRQLVDHESTDDDRPLRLIYLDASQYLSL